MSPPDRVWIKEEVFPERRRGKATRFRVPFSRVEPAEGRPQHHESPEEDGAIEITGKLSAIKRAMETIEPSPGQCLLRNRVFSSKIKRGSKKCAEEKRPGEEYEHFEETGSEERALGHRFSFLRWIEWICNVSRTQDGGTQVLTLLDGSHDPVLTVVRRPHSGRDGSHSRDRSGA